MKRKEPLASTQELAGKIKNADRATLIDLESHGTAHALVSGRMMLSFVDMPANSFAEPHSHEDIEQITIILKGDVDFVLKGKLYPVHEGDIVVFAPEEEHGGYVGPNGARVLDVFCPPRPDLLQKMREAESGR